MKRTKRSIVRRAIQLRGRSTAVVIAGALALLPGGLASHSANANPHSAARRGVQGTQTAAPDLTVLEYSLPTASSGPYGLAEGPDGNMWIVEQTANKIARMSPDGSSFTEYQIPTPDSRPWGMTLGPDSNLWFAEGDGNKIGKFSVPAGSGAISITEFPVPTAGASPFQITPGPDGNIWFSETLVDKIGKITPSGTVTEFSLPTQLAYPYGITTGSDGSVWFTEYLSNKIGRVTPAGVFTEFAIPTSGSFPFGIASALSGELWFTEQGAGQIAAITTAGAITEFPTDSPKSGPSGIVSLEAPVGGRAFVAAVGQRPKSNSAEIPAGPSSSDVEEQFRRLAWSLTDAGTLNLSYGGVPPSNASPCGDVSIKQTTNPRTFFLDVSCPNMCGPGGCDLYQLEDKDLTPGEVPDWVRVPDQSRGSASIYELFIDDHRYTCFCLTGGHAADNLQNAGHLRAADSTSGFAYDPTSISIPTPNSGAFVIAAGPGGRYFTEMNANKVGRIVRSIAINPIYQQVSSGSQASFTLTDLAVQGPVSWTAAVQKADGTTASSVTAAVNPVSLSQGGSAMLTVSTTSSAAPGDYAVGVEATSADGFRVVGAEFTVVAPDFSLAIDPATVTTTAGNKINITVSVVRTSGFAGNVTVTPPAVTLRGFKLPSDPLATTGTSVTFKIKIKGSAQPGSYQLVLTGTDDSGRSRTFTVTIVVQPG